MMHECFPDCCNICIGDVGYNVIGRFHTIVSMGMSTGACQLFSSTWSGVNDSLVLVTNSKCSLHRTSTKLRRRKSVTSELRTLWRVYIPNGVENDGVTCRGTGKIIWVCNSPTHISWCFVKFVILPLTSGVDCVELVESSVDFWVVTLFGCFDSKTSSHWSVTDTWTQRTVRHVKSNVPTISSPNL